VSEIEISEAAKQAARELVLPKYFLLDERERLEWLINDVARHFDRFAIAATSTATATVESRVADAVKAERERIIAKLLSHVPKNKWLMEARLREGLEFAASLIVLEPIVSEAISNPQPTPEATT